MDYYLIRPVSSLFFLSLRDFSPNSFLNLLMTLGIMVWSLVRYGEGSLLTLLPLYLLLLLPGAFLYYLVRMISIIPVFWTISGRGLDQLFWQVARFMERPDRIFHGWVRKLLLSLLPFSIMASFPARLILEEFRWEILFHLWGTVALFYFIVVLFWKLALRFYSSASS